MKFLMMIKVDENVGMPPQALFDAMGKLIAEQSASGVLVETAGLRRSAEGARVQVRNGRINVLDGPFTEAKELVGGFAIINAASRDEAIGHARDFVQLHVTHWPGLEFECEVRQIEG